MYPPAASSSPASTRVRTGFQVSQRSHRTFLYLLGATLGLLLWIPANTQMIPDAPVIGFQLPMFGDDGYRIWNLTGKQGLYVNENRIDVVDMHLLIYSKVVPGAVETEILSPQATMLIKDNKAMGNETITVLGPNFEVRGQRWSWDGDEDRVVIDEQVKITFFEELSGILP